MIVLFAGLPGVGKTTLAKKIVSLTNWDYLNKDDIRDAIFPANSLDYSEEQNQLAAYTMQSVASYILKKDPKKVLLIDGRPFRKKSHIYDFYKIAQDAGSECCIIHCTAPEDIVKERLKADPGPPSAERTWSKAEHIHQKFEPITYQHLTLEMTDSLDKLADKSIAYISGNRVR